MGARHPSHREEAPCGRLLAGIRGVRLEVEEVRAKFEYADQKPEAVRRRMAAGLAARGAPGDAAARAGQLRRAGGATDLSG
jgi:transcriptional regulator